MVLPFCKTSADLFPQGDVSPYQGDLVSETVNVRTRG